MRGIRLAQKERQVALDDLSKAFEYHLVDVGDVVLPRVAVVVRHLEQVAVLLDETVNLLSCFIEFFVAVGQTLFLVVEKEQRGFAFGTLVQGHIVPRGHQTLNVFHVGFGLV